MRSSRTLLAGWPALVLAAVVAANEPRPEHPDADTTGTTAERAPSARIELRPAPQAAPAEKRPVRVILPSPYSARP